MRPLPVEWESFLDGWIGSLALAMILQDFLRQLQQLWPLPEVSHKHLEQLVCLQAVVEKFHHGLNLHLISVVGPEQLPHPLLPY